MASSPAAVDEADAVYLNVLEDSTLTPPQQSQNNDLSKYDPPPKRQRPNVIPEDLWLSLYSEQSTQDAGFDKNDRPKRTLCIKILPPDANEIDIKQAFGQVKPGDDNAADTASAAIGIKDVRIVRDYDTGECTGYGFIDFDTTENASKALNNFQGIRLPGRQTSMTIEWAKTATVSPLDAYQVYIGNLSEDIDDVKLLAFARSYSTNILSAKVILDARSGLSQGYGFLRFRHEDDARVAMKRMAGVPLGKYPVIIRFVYKKSQERYPGDVPTSNTVVFVANLNPQVTEKDLQDLFGSFGPLSGIRVANLRNFAFVSFLEHTSALAAITHMTGYVLKGQKMACAWGRNRALPYRVRIESTPDHHDILQDDTYNDKWHKAMQPHIATSPTKEGNTREEDSLPPNQAAYWLSMLAGPMLQPPNTDERSQESSTTVREPI